jgi:hypothetical protein
MKGVIAKLAPAANVIDLSHEVAPQHLQEAAYILLSAYRYFPSGTIFCCVVDPGVGSTRRGLAVRARLQNSDYLFVCPDNGLLTPIFQNAETIQAVSLDKPQFQLENPSATFHGRDIFAPVAAHLAADVALDALGSSLNPSTLIQLDWPQVSYQDNCWHAQILHVDHFGNLISNLSAERLEPPFERYQLSLGNVTINGIKRTFADVAVGEAVAYMGSSGFLELAIRQGDAAKAWQGHVGSTLLIRNKQF